MNTFIRGAKYTQQIDFIHLKRQTQYSWKTIACYSALRANVEFTGPETPHTFSQQDIQSFTAKDNTNTYMGKKRA